MGELLIEQAPEPRQLLGIAEILGVGRLVELRGEGAIGGAVVGGIAVAREDPGSAWPPGIVVARAWHQLATDLLGAGIAVILLALGNAGLERALRTSHR